MINGVASIAVGLWLIAVVWQGNGAEARKLFYDNKGFFPWLFSALVLYWLWKNPATSELGRRLVSIAFIAFLILAGSKFWQDWATTFDGGKG